MLVQARVGPPLLLLGLGLAPRPLPLGAEAVGAGRLLQLLLGLGLVDDSLKWQRLAPFSVFVLFNGFVELVDLSLELLDANLAFLLLLLEEVILRPELVV